jgi:hypothetical protein
MFAPDNLCNFLIRFRRTEILESVRITVPAQLYTASFKYSTTVALWSEAEEISYYDPERRAQVTVGEDCRLSLKNRGWFFTDFFATDLKNSPPQWQHKLTLYKSDGDKVISALTDWSK